MAKWIKSKKTGVRWREHPTRRHGTGKDRYFTIFYKKGGEMIEEALGWASQKGWTEAKASLQRGELLKNQHAGEGPYTLKEKREKAEVAKAIEKAEGLTLTEFWDKDYIHNLKSRCQKPTWEKEIEHYLKRIKTPMGDKPLKTITNVDIDRMLDLMRAEGYSPRSQQYAVGTLHRIWKHAAKRKYVKAGDNPAIGVNLVKVNNTRLRVFTPVELQNILKYLDTTDKAAYDLTLFCMFIGCRFSDAAKLTWEHVDLNRDTATFTDTKNKDTRTVYLILEVVEMLKRRGTGRPGEYVFTMKDGKPWTEPPSAFRTAIEKLNLNEGRGKRDIASFHTLRHTAATFAARRGVPVKDMQIIFGWKTPSMVFRYAKGDEETQRRAMSGLAESLTPGGHNEKV